MDLPLGPEKLAKMMGMSVQQMEEEFQSSWTRVAVSDVMEMRLVGDTRGLGSKPRPGPQYFPRLPNRVAEDDTWRDRGVQLVSAWFKGHCGLASNPSLISKPGPPTPNSQTPMPQTLPGP